MDWSEFVKIRIKDIPQELFLGCNLLPFVQNCWVYFEIIHGWYGLSQSGRLSNDLVRKRLNKAGHSKSVTTPGLWKHTWRLIQFCLIVDNFGIEHVGEKHAHHLRAVLQEHYEILEDWNATRFARLDLEWNYTQRHLDRTCRLSIKYYIKKTFL